MNKKLDTLVIIPARAGSKGVPGKNLKNLGGKQLILHTVDFARNCLKDAEICISTDSPEIKKLIEQSGLKVPFIRPENLAQDDSPTYPLLNHALNHYLNQRRSFKKIILLQPTSPFRKPEHLLDAIECYSSNIDMVMSVVKADINPYYNSYIENKDGYLMHVDGSTKPTRRQDSINVYNANGSIYIINPQSLKRYDGFSEFTAIRKYEMEKVYSVDLDDLFDWEFAEFLIEKGLV